MDRRDDETRALVPVLRRGSHDPRVDRRPDGTLVYEIYVASGHADRVCRFPLAEHHLPVLRDDAERYYLLYAATRGVADT